MTVAVIYYVITTTSTMTVRQQIIKLTKTIYILYFDN